MLCPQNGDRLVTIDCCDVTSPYVLRTSTATTREICDSRPHAFRSQPWASCSHTCICHQAVRTQLGTGQGPVKPRGWEGNRRPRVLDFSASDLMALYKSVYYFYYYYYFTAENDFLIF